MRESKLDDYHIVLGLGYISGREEPSTTIRPNKVNLLSTGKFYAINKTHIQRLTYRVKILDLNYVFIVCEGDHSGILLYCTIL